MINYIILGAILLLAGLVVFRAIGNKRRGISGCSNCSGCAASSICPSQQSRDSTLLK